VQGLDYGPFGAFGNELLRKTEIMDRSTLGTFQKAIRANFGCESSLEGSEPLSETFEGELAWEALVHVFRLHGHSEAQRCYAWAAGEDEIVTVLGVPPVKSARDAVRAAIVAEAEG